VSGPAPRGQPRVAALGFASSRCKSTALLTASQRAVSPRRVVLGMAVVGVGGMAVVLETRAPMEPPEKRQRKGMRVRDMAAAEEEAGTTAEEVAE